MSSDLYTRPLEECLDALIDYRGKTPEKTSFGIPLITAKIIKNGRIETPTEFIAVDNYDSWMRRGIPKAGDVVLTVEAPLGEVAQLGPEKIALAQRVVTLRGKRGILDNTYLLYLLQTEEIQEKLRARATGTTVLGIKQSELRKVSVTLPPIADQINAAATLKTLDDRITLLRETNVTLEAIAQALFKSWFVDFDPVRAKQEGRAPEGMDGTTAALFPDSFEESELGLVPKMWEAVTLGKFLTESTKRVGKTDAIVLSAVQSGELVKSSEHFHKKVHSEDIGKYKAVPKHSFAYNPSRINIGSIGMNEFDSLGAVSPVYVVATAETTEHGYFLWHQLKMKNIQERIKNLCSGTVRQSLSFKDFASIPIAVPPYQLLSEFSQIRKILYKRIVKNTEQIEVLTSIRDTLLPRLISGQLRLNDAAEALTGT